MKTLLQSLPFLALTLLAAESHAQEAAYLPGDVLVMLQPGQRADALVKDLALVDGLPTHLRVVKEVSAPMRTWLLHTDQTALSQRALLRAVQQHPGTQMAQNNHVISERIVPNDPTFGSQWHHVNTNDADIDSDLAWDIATGGLTATGDTIVVCIIENADLPHVDLIGNAWFNHQEIPNDGVDNDANGYIDDYQGWNPAGSDDAVYGGGHGTQVAGMIGAKGDNGLAVAGANWNVKMMVVTRDGIGEAEVVESYTYPWMMRRLYNQTGGNKGAFVVATNASWGIDFGDPADAPLWCAVYDSLGAEGVLNCGATANQAIDIDVEGDLPTGCPSPFMVSVTATNNMDMRTFSAYGATTIDVGAPGADVVTTSIGGGTGSTSGTSFASPLTAGVIGLLYSAPCSNLMSLVYADPEAGALYVRDKLFEGVEQVGNLPGNTLTGGRINSNNSLMAIMAACGPCPSPFDLNATNTGIGDVLFSWAASGGAPFTLEYRPVGDSTWTTEGGLINSSSAASGLLTCTEYEFQVSVQCDSITSDPSGLFNWTTEGCCAAPADLATGFVGDDLANVTWTPVLAAMAYDVRYSQAGLGVWIEILGIVNPGIAISSLSPCAAYDVQVRSLCSGVPTAWSNTITLQTSGCGACLDNVYCTSASDDASEEWIANVTVGTLNNTTVSDDGYGDYTSESTTLIIGDPAAISLSPAFAGTVFEEGFTVWIDLDHDGAFTTTGELVFSAPLSDATVTGNLFIPLGALAGSTRMRVIMVYNENAATGCEDAYEFGETEDYCVNLVDPNTGMNEVVAGPSLTHFPDPADRVVFFDLHGANGTVMIELLDNAGRAVERGSTANGRLTLTTAWLPDGLYFFRATQQERELGRGKLMVAH